MVKRHSNVMTVGICQPLFFAYNVSSNQIILDMFMNHSIAMEQVVVTVEIKLRGIRKVFVVSIIKVSRLSN